MVSPLLQADTPMWRKGDRAAYHGRTNGTITGLALSNGSSWKEGTEVDAAPKSGAIGTADITLDTGEKKWCPLSSLTPPI